MLNSMDRGLRQMLWMSWTLRSQVLCLNYAIRNQVSQITKQNYWADNKDIRWSDKLEPLKKIMQAPDRYSTKDFLHVLSSINMKHPNLEVKDTLHILTALTKIAREEKCRKDFVNNEGFKHLCEQLKKQIRLMSLNEVVDSIKLLTFLKIPASTLIMNNLLQILRNSINDLQIHQVHLMLSLLNKMEQTPLSSALSIALPIVLPTIINTKLNYDDLHELSIALYRLKFLEKHGMFIKILISIQLVIREKSNTAPIYIIKNIFRSLCFVPSTKSNSVVYLDTMKLIQETLYHKACKLEGADIIECIQAINNGVINGNMVAYNSTFMNMLLEMGMSRNIQYYSGCKILNYLNNIGHVYVPFLEYVINKCLAEEINSHDVNVLLNAFCLSNYKSVPWTYLEKQILQKHYLSNCPIHYLLECVMYLTALDKYYPQLLSTVFIKVDVKMLKSFENIAKHCRRFLILYQGVKTFYSEYKGPWPPQETLTYAYKMANLSTVRTETLKKYLQVAMGGHEYVLNNLRTQIGHNIDCAVIMKKGGYPIPFSAQNLAVLANNYNYAEELECPPESYIILILAFQRTAYSINTLHLSNVKKLELKSLEKWTGHKCIDVNSNIMKMLPNQEKVSYIMEKIKNICDDVVPAM